MGADMSISNLLEAFEELTALRRSGQTLDGGDRKRWRALRGELEQVLFQQPENTAADRRDHLRLPVAMRVSYWSRNELKDRYVRVLGEGGLFVAGQDALPVGTRLELAIDLVRRGLTLRLPAEVVFVLPAERPDGPGMGLKFVELSYEQKAALYDLVDDNLRQQLLERRRSTRLDSRLQARFLGSAGSFVLPTADLSADGLYVTTDHLLLPGERAKLLLMVPGREQPVRAVAEVTRVVESDLPGMPAGLGLQFVMVDPAGRRAVLDYMVGRVCNRFGPADPRHELRASPRIHRRVPVLYRIQSYEGWSYSRDLSASGLFLQTPDPPGPGTGLRLVLKNPVDDLELPLDGRVVRVVAPDPGHPHRLPGAGIAYSDLTPPQRERLTSFMKQFILLGR